MADPETTPTPASGVNLVSLDPSQNPYAADAVDPMGFLANDPAPAAPSNVDMPDPDSSSHPGFLASLEEAASTTVQAAEKEVAAGYSAVKTVASDVSQGAVNTAQKVVNIGTGAVTSVSMNLVIILAVVGVSLVLIARTGAVKAII